MIVSEQRLFYLSAASAGLSDIRILVPLEFICSILRGDFAGYPASESDTFADEVLFLAEIHGVLALMHDHLSAGGEIGYWPQDIRQQLSAAVKDRAVRELLLKHELAALLQQLADAGISALLIKGTPLAYTHYPQPYLRTRCDTDILIPQSDRQLAHEFLVQSGFVADLSHRNMVSHQADYRRSGKGGNELVIDLHWRLSNLQYFAWAFDFDELFESATDVPGLWAGARAPGPMYALLIACMHRATNAKVSGSDGLIGQREPNRLIWLYDIHLLCKCLSASDWSRFIAIAASKGIRTICLDGLSATRSCLGTRVPASVMDRLAAPGPPELSAGYLKRGFLRTRYIDLRSLPDWRRRVRILADWTFPTAKHMLDRYGVRSRWLLPYLYLRRAAEVSRKLIRPD